jgi:hypothetical protein
MTVIVAHLSTWYQLDALERTLASVIAVDPEQEVQSIAVPVLDAVIADVKQQIGSSPAVDALADVFSVEAIEAGSVRAVDALLVVSALKPLLPNATVHSARGIRLPR